MIAIDLSKQLALDPKVIHQINLTGKLNQRGGATIFSNTEEVKYII